MKLILAIAVIELISRCVGGVMQSMPSIASCMDLDFKRLNYSMVLKASHLAP